MIKDSIPLRLAFCSAAIFSVMGLQLPFWPVWLRDHGVTAEGIGVLVAMGYFIRAIAGPTVSILADRIGDRRVPLIAAASLFTLAFVAFLFTGSFWPILLVSVFAYAGAAPMVPLKESLTMGYVALKGYDYGRIRLWGSLAFVLMTIVGGWIMTHFGSGGILWGSILLGGVIIGAAWLLPADPRKGEAAGNPLRLSTVWALVRQPTFLVFMGAVSMTMSSHAVYYAFGTLNWQSLGYSDSFIGFLWALGVIAEIILFLFSARVLKRVPPLILIPLAGGVAVLRWIITAFNPIWWILIAVQCLHAFTFGALHLGAMHYISRYVPMQVGASAMGLLAATSGGLVIGLVMMGAGPLYEGVGPNAYFAMAGLGALGLGLALLLRHLHASDAANAAEPQIS